MTQPCNPHPSPGVGGNTLRRCWELDPLGSLGVPKENTWGVVFRMWETSAHLPTHPHWLSVEPAVEQDFSGGIFL